MVFWNDLAELVLLWEGCGWTSSMGHGKRERGGLGCSEPSTGSWTTTTTNHQRQHHSHPQVPHWLCQDLCKCNTGLCGCEGCGIGPHTCLWESFCFWSILMCWKLPAPWRTSWNSGKVFPWVPSSHQVRHSAIIFNTNECLTTMMTHKSMGNGWWWTTTSEWDGVNVHRTWLLPILSMILISLTRALNLLILYVFQHPISICRNFSLILSLNELSSSYST